MQGGVGHAQHGGGDVHSGNERGFGSGVPVGEDLGHVVGGGEHHGLQGLAFGGLLAGGDRDQGLLGVGLCTWCFLGVRGDRGWGASVLMQGSASRPARAGRLGTLLALLALVVVSRWR